MKKNGGPAFPCASSVVDANEKTASGFAPLIAIDIRGGMTLRDYFAAAALSGTLKDNENCKALFGYAKNLNKDVGEIVAGSMYAIADAMLAERDK